MELQLPGSAGCVTAPASGSTISLSSIPQVTADADAPQEVVSADPKGLSFVLVFAVSATDWIEASEIFPNQPPLTSCLFVGGGPNWGAFTSTN